MIYARDIIAGLLIIGIFVAITLGYNSHLYPILAVIVGYYFSKRVYEEKNGVKGGQ